MNHPKELFPLFERELNKLIEDLSLYQSESSVWVVQGAISNSAGNLSLHIAGSLNYFIGAVLGQTGYKRDRPAEFSGKGFNRATLIAKLKDTETMLREVLGQLDDGSLDMPYPEGHHRIENMTIGWFLIHLYGHLTYHAGQVNYHRRLINSNQ